MSFCQTRKRSTQSSNVDRRVAGMLVPPGSEICRYVDRVRNTAGAKSFSSMPSKAGRPLFEKRANALLAVMRMEALQLMLDFLVQSGDKRFLIVCENGLFYGANGNLRPNRYLCRQALCFGAQPVRGENVIDDAEAQRRFRVDHIPSVEKFRGLSRADKLRQKVRAAIIREQTNLGKILPEHSIFRGNADIRREGKIHTGASGGAVYGGN